MGIIDWFRALRRRVSIGDRLWLTKRAKLSGLRDEITQALADAGGPDAVFVVAHFQDCLEDLRSLVAAAGLDEERVRVMLSSALEGRTAGAATEHSQGILILVAERHPLASHDDALASFAHSLRCRCRLVQHASLEDPLLRALTDEWMERLLRQLGMQEDEPLESSLISGRIRAAQQKIERSAPGHSPAQSAQEWLELYCPNL